MYVPVVRYSHVNTVRGANVNRGEFPPRETVTDLLSTAIDRGYLTHCFAVVLPVLSDMDDGRRR